MRKKILRYARYRQKYFMSSIIPTFAVSLVSLLIGIIVAAIIISKTPIDTIRGLGDSIVLSGSEGTVIESFWKCSKYHIFIWLISTSFLGVVLVPMALAYRGFVLCCSSAALIFDYGIMGAVISAAMFGLTALVSIPCLLIVATDSMSSSLSLFSQRYGIKRRGSYDTNSKRSLICILIMLPLAFIEHKIIPILLEYLYI